MAAQWRGWEHYGTKTNPFTSDPVVTVCSKPHWALNTSFNL